MLVSELFQSRPEIEPVWNRLPQFFAYPLKPAVLIVLVAFTVLYAVSWWLFFPVSTVLWLFALMGLYKFAYEVLAETASGSMDPPEGGYSAGTDYMVFKHVGLMMVMPLASVLVGGATGSPAAFWMVTLFLVLAWPAAIITLAMTESLIAALNPLTWAAMMGRIGWPYLAACAFLFLMQSSESFVTSIAAQMMGRINVTTMSVGFFIGGYFLMASFHLMGYLVYQYHEELGVEVDGESLEATDARTEDQRLVAESRQLVEDGRAEEAVELLGNHLRQRGGEPALHDQYRKLLRLREDNDRLLEHGREYVTLLLQSFEDKRKALRVTEECLDIDPEFRPADGSQVRELVDQADRFDLDHLVVRLSNGFAKRFPKHRDIPAVHLVAARHLSEKKGKDELALKVLKDLQARYPDHELREEIDRQVALLEKVIGSSKLQGQS